MERRKWLRQVGGTVAAFTAANILANCGSSEDAQAQAEATTPNQNVSLTDLKAIADYYAANNQTYISSNQSAGTTYATKVYANTHQVSSEESSIAAGGETTKTLAVIRGMYMDPADSGHNATIATAAAADGDGVTITFSVDHGLVTATSTSHGITAFDFWLAGTTTGPAKTYEVTEAAGKNTELTVSMTAAEIGDAKFAYLIAHCNNHGGRIVIAPLEV